MTPLRIASTVTLAAAALGFGLARIAVTPHRESWTLVAVNADTAIVLARLSQGNTGLFGDQVTARLTMLPARGPILEHRAIDGPGTLDETGVRAGTDSLVEADGEWRLRLDGDTLRARVVVRGAENSCPPRPGEVQGVIEAGSGAQSAGEPLGLTLAGTGVVVRTAATGAVGGSALYVIAPDFAAAVDPLAACSAWVRSGDREWAGKAAPIDESDHVSLGPWVLRLRRWQDTVVQEPLGHTLLPERMLSRLAGFAAPRLTITRTTVAVQGLAGKRTGVVIDRGRQ